MKKFLSFLMTVAMLASIMTAFAIGTAAAAEPLSAELYSVSGTPELYLVFNKKVALPESLRICLVGHGWPVTVDGQEIFRYLRRMPDSATPPNLVSGITYHGDTKQVLKFTPSDPTPGNYDWYYNPAGAGAQYEAPIAGATKTVDDFCLMFFGTVKTEDGKETAKTEDFDVVDNNGNEPVLRGTKIKWKVVDKVESITVPTALPSIDPNGGNNPSTSDSLFFAAAALVCTAGVVVFAKKKF